MKHDPCKFGAPCGVHTQLSIGNRRGFSATEACSSLPLLRCARCNQSTTHKHDAHAYATVIHTKADDIADDCRIIADLYKKQFKQEAVLINTAQTAPILV